MATLRLVPVSGQPIDVVKDQTVVGRDPSCEIVVADGSVSRRHARLEQRGGIWWVVDQGSANGTYLNSLRIAEQALKNGQELRFGALAFRVDLKEDPEATVATPVLKDDSATLMATPDPPARAALENACARLLAAPTLPRTRDKGGRSVGYDLRPLVTSIDVLEAAPGRVAGLRIRTRFDPEKGVGRPEEVLAALSELAGTPLEATATIRERLLLADEANEA